MAAPEAEGSSSTTGTMAPSWGDMLGGVIWESKRIVAAHTRHFLALSVLFLLPLSLLLVAAPTFHTSSSSSGHQYQPLFLRRSSTNHHHQPPAFFLYSLLYGAAAALLFLSASAAVAHSVRHGFFGRPVRLLPALRSLPSSLCRLVPTLLSAVLLLTAYLALIASLLLLCLFRALPLLLGDHHHLSPVFYAAVVSLALMGAMIYVQVNWALAGVIAVAESSWGFEPLRRSAHLLRGMRWAVLCLSLFFSAGVGLITLLLFWLSSSSSTLGWGGGAAMAAAEMKEEDWGGTAPVVACVVCASVVTMSLLLYGLVSNTVLYMYCKALHGELAGEIADEFTYEYVCLPFDDRNVPDAVSLVWH